MAGEELVVDGELHVHQCIAQAVYVVHRVVFIL
jgi:hypothetical protein